MDLLSTYNGTLNKERESEKGTVETYHLVQRSPVAEIRKQRNIFNKCIKL